MRWLICCILMLLAPVAAFADAPPSWVKLAQLANVDADTKDFIDSGVHRMISDVQARITPDGYDLVIREVQAITSRIGLEEVGNLKIDFDPSKQELKVHDIWLTRHGVRQKINGVEFIDIRRETEIDYGILDGRLTRQANIPGLRVGDTIDVSWTLETRHSVFPEHFIYWRSERPIFGFQVDQFRLLARSDRDISIKGPATPLVTISNGWTEFVWRHENTPAADFGRNGGDWIHDLGGTQITTATDWPTIVDTIAESYAPAALPLDLATIVDGFTGTPQERATAAFRLVQSDVRYLGIEIGPGGYLPRSPETVWSRRFGDCKDKALLLVSMLTHMGLEADVALVSLGNPEEVSHFAPSPYLFDHAIVRVADAGGHYFLDPTDLMQGGVGSDVSVSDFRWALPITANSSLVAVEDPKPALPNYDVLSSYHFQDTGDWAAELTVATTYRRQQADENRYRLSYSGTEQHAENHLDWYVDRYPGAQVLTPMFITDDLDTNTLVIHEHYGLTDEGLADYQERFWLNPYATKGELDELPDEALTSTYEITPVFNRHRIEMVGMPHLVPIRSLIMENKFFRFTREGKEIPGGVAAEFQIETLTKEISPSDATAYSEAVEGRREESDWWVGLHASKRMLAQPFVFGVSISTFAALSAVLVTLGLILLAARSGYRAERKKFLEN